MYIGVVPVCTSVCHVDAAPTEGRRGIRSHGDFKRTREWPIAKMRRVGRTSHGAGDGAWRMEFRHVKHWTHLRCQSVLLSCLCRGYVSMDVSGGSQATIIHSLDPGYQINFSMV